MRRWWWALWALAGCASSEEVPPGGTEVASPPYAACEVRVGPGEVSAASPWRRRIYLPGVRPGAPWPYEAALPEGVSGPVLEGALPPGLRVEGGAVLGAVSVAPEETTDYRAILTGEGGEEVETWLSVEGTERRGEVVAAPSFDQLGPFGVWSTHPGAGCDENPWVPGAGGAPVAALVTYPTVGEPTQTGDGSVAPGRWPVLVFAHANSASECEIFERYRGLHRYWASWGVVVVSVDNQLQNCQRGSEQNIIDRAAAVLGALESLEGWDQEAGGLLAGRLDLGRVAVAGHSRGGAAALLAARHPRVRAVIDLQGVTYGFDGWVPPIPALVVVAGEDKDTYYPYVEPTEDALTGPYAWVNLNGAIHDYTADDVPLEEDDAPLITREVQHRMTSLVTLAFLDRFLGLGDGADPATQPRPERSGLLFGWGGDTAVKAAGSPLGIYARWRSGVVAVWLDDFGAERSAGQNLLGGAYIGEGLVRSENVLTYAASGGTTGAYAWSRSRRLEAGEGGGVWTMEVLPGGEGLAVDPGARWVAQVKGPDGVAPPRFRVVIEGDDGAEVAVEAAEALGGLEALSDRFAQLEVPLAGVERVARVRLELEAGGLYIDNIRIE